MSVNHPVWPGIFPGARLKRAHKAEIIEAVNLLQEPTRARTKR